MDCITTGKPGRILEGAIKDPDPLSEPLMSSLCRGKRGAGDLIPWTVSQQVSQGRSCEGALKVQASSWPLNEQLVLGQER